MIGNIRFNLLAGLIGFIFTFLFTLRNNLWMTSLNRAFIAFVIWFALAYLLRWVFTLAFKPAERSDTPDEAAHGQLGNRLDMTTPDEDKELMSLIKPEPEQNQEGKGFVPLNPPKLVSTKDPEELAKAVRHLTEK